MAEIDDLIKNVLSNYQGVSTPPDETDAGSNDQDYPNLDQDFSERGGMLQALLAGDPDAQKAIAAYGSRTGQTQGTSTGQTPATPAGNPAPPPTAPTAAAGGATNPTNPSRFSPETVAASNQNYIGGYQKSMQDWLAKMLGSNQDINSAISSNQQDMQKYQDPLSLANQQVQYDRVAQAAAATAPARFTTMGSVLHNVHPDVSGATNAIAQMASDTQGQQARSQAIDTQNFQNWLNQQVRQQGVDTQNLSNQKDMAGMGIAANDRLAAIQAQADARQEMNLYRQALLGARNAPDETPQQKAQEKVAQDQANTRVALTSPGSDVPQSAKAATDTTNGAVDAQGNWFQRNIAAGLQHLGVPSDTANALVLNPDGGTAILSNDVALTRLGAAIGDKDPEIAAMIKQAQATRDPNIRKSYIDQINQRIAQIGSTSASGQPAAVVSAQPTQGTTYTPPVVRRPDNPINALAGQLGSSTSNALSQTPIGQALGQIPGSMALLPHITTWARQNNKSLSNLSQDDIKAAIDYAKQQVGQK